MGFFSSTKNQSPLVWNHLSLIDQLDEIDRLSESEPVMILKHSTRCSISEMAKNRLELYWDKSIGIKPYYLDLLSHRDLSNKIALRYHVTHASPQILLLKNGVCVYHASHSEIDFNKLKTCV